MESLAGPHSIDLMALDSNSQCVRHYTPFPSLSTGINFHPCISLALRFSTCCLQRQRRPSSSLILSPDHIGGQSSADTRLHGTYWPRRGTTRPFYGLPSGMGSTNLAKPRYLGIYGFFLSEKSLTLTVSKFLSLVCPQELHDLETCHANGMCPLLCPKLLILSTMRLPLTPLPAGKTK